MVVQYYCTFGHVCAIFKEFIHQIWNLLVMHVGGDYIYVNYTVCKTETSSIADRSAALDRCLYTQTIDVTWAQNFEHPLWFYIFIYFTSWSGSSVSIASDYAMDGPGSNPVGDEIFRNSRPALGPTQPPVKWYRVFPGGKVRQGRAADHSPPSSAAVMEE